MHQDPSGMLARIPFGLTTGPIEGAEILVAGCRKETVASEMRSNVLKYRDTLIICIAKIAYRRILTVKELDQRLFDSIFSLEIDLPLMYRQGVEIGYVSSWIGGSAWPCLIKFVSGDGNKALA